MNTPQKLEIKAGLQMLKPVHEVFDAIINPEKMKNYFIAKSSGPMEQGKTLSWTFPEMEMEFPVLVSKIVKDQLISFSWGNAGEETQTEIVLKPGELEGATFVSITERSKDNNEAGINWLRGNTEGWANFLACLKAWLEHGINLRKGAFMKSQMPEKTN